MNEKWLEWAPRAALAGSILLVVSAAAHLTGTAITPKRALPNRLGAGSAAAAPSASYDHASRILMAKLMGEPPKAAPVAQPAQAPETRLNLKLIGVLATGGEAGIAIIADSGGEEKMYAVGARIPGGAVLRQVMADRVLLEGPTGLETLHLFDPTQGDQGASRGASARTSHNSAFLGRFRAGIGMSRVAAGSRMPSYVRTAHPQRAIGPAREISATRSRYSGSPGTSGQLNAPSASFFSASQGDAGTTASASTEGQLNTSDLGQLRDQLVSNPALLAGMVSAREVRQNGQVIGYELNFQTNSRAVSQLGLHSGDVVTQVNGIALTSASQGLRALNVLASASRVSATVQRGRQVIQVNRSF